MNVPEYVTVRADGTVDRDHERDAPEDDRPDAAELEALARDLKELP